ncbi:peptidase [Streptomyces sp. NPDC002577]
MGAALAVLASAFLGTTGSAAAFSDDEEDAGFIGFRLLEAPVVRRDDPRALTYVVDHLKPGTTIHRRFEVSNHSEAKREVNLYPAAAAIASNKFVFAEGRTPNELTEWTRVDPPVVRLAPHQRVDAHITIKVPDTAMPGERYAVVWAESGAPPDATHNIGSIIRIGVRVYLDIGNSGEYADFRIDKLDAHRARDGRPSVLAHVRNTGRRALDLKGKLFLTDGPGGLSAGAHPITEGMTLPPGGQGTVTVDGLDGRLPAGPWKARLQLESGLVKRSISARLTFPPPGGTLSALIGDPSDRTFWYGVAGVVAVGTGLTGFLLKMRRWRKAA